MRFPWSALVLLSMISMPAIALDAGQRVSTPKDPSPNFNRVVTKKIDLPDGPSGLVLGAKPLTDFLPSVEANGDMMFLPGRKIGRVQDGKTLLQPERIEIQGTGSTGDVSGTSVAPSGSAPTGTLARQFFDKQATTYAPDLGPGVIGDTRSVAEALDAGYLDARALGFRSCLLNCTAAKIANNIAAANINTKLSAVGGTVYFRRGLWPLSQPTVITDKHFGVLGEGEGRTIFLFDGPGNLFEVTEASLNYRVDFQGFTAWAASTDAATAIKIVRPTGLSSAERGPNVKNVEFIGSDPTKFQWQTGIDCLGCWNVTISDNLFRGKDGAFTADFAVLRDRATPATIINNKVYGFNRAVYMPPGGFSEGLIAIANQFVSGNWGVYMDDGTNAPGAQIIANHMAVFKGGVVSIARPQVVVSNNIIYRVGANGGGTDSPSWIGVYFGPASSDAQATDNLIYCYKNQVTGESTAIAGTQSVAGTVSGGMLADCTYGLNANASWTLGYDRIKTRNVQYPTIGIPSGSYAGSVWTF